MFSCIKVKYASKFNKWATNLFFMDSFVYDFCITKLHALVAGSYFLQLEIGSIFTVIMKNSV